MLDPGQPQDSRAAYPDSQNAGASPSPTKRLSVSGGLPARLLALFLLCLLPVFIADIYASVDFRTRQRAALGDFALRQSQLANADMDSVVEGARHLMQAVALLPSVRTHDPSCASDLTTLQRQMPEYAFLAVLDAEGAVVCSSAPGIIAGERPAWEPDIPEAGDFRLGHFDTLPDGRTFLPMIQAIPEQSAANRSDLEMGAVVVALDLRSLEDHLAVLWKGRAEPRPDSTIIVTDSDATVIGRYPPAPEWLGRTMSDEAMNLVSERRAGVGTLRMPDGTDQIAGFVPSLVPPVGLATIVLIPVQDQMPWFDIPGGREIIIVALAGLLAIVLTLFAARRYYTRPLQNLLQAAALLRDGRLGARADVSASSGELAVLTAAFNRMAEAAQARDTAQHQAAATLEARLDARTQSLAEANARLQAETAQRERAETALQEIRKGQAIGEISGAIAHDFNNVLATVLGSLDLLDRYLLNARSNSDATAAERLRNLIARASQAVERGAQLSTRLRTLARRRRPAAPQADLGSLIGDVVVLAAGSLGGGAHVESDLPEETWPVTIGADQAEAAILALCQAARAVAANGGYLMIEAENATVETPTAGGPPAGDYVRLTLRDSLGRLGQDELARALVPLAYGPNVLIDLEDSSGAEASVMLARAASGGLPHARQPRAGGRMPAPLFAHPPILVVDDDAAVRLVTVDMLREMGGTVIEAASAQEALAMLDAPSPSIGVILVDYAMPGQNGIEFVRAVRARGLIVPIVMATGFADFGDPGEAHTALLDALLRKPFSMEELHATLTRLHAARGAPGTAPVAAAPHAQA